MDRGSGPDPGAGRAAGNARARVSEGYLNLSGVAGLSPVRDTSSCESSSSALNDLMLIILWPIDYNGPRRGEHYYGYQDYDDFY